MLNKICSNSNDAQSRPVKISGYTLLELLIVLAILAALAAMTLPAMRGPLDKSRLRGAARQVQAAISKARFLSIREGSLVEFRYQINGSRWVIQTAPSPFEAAQGGFSEAGDNATGSGLMIENSDAGDSFGETGSGLEESGFSSQSGQPRILREGELPVTITFADLLQDDDEMLSGFRNTKQDSQFEFQTEDFSSDPNGLELNAAGEQIVWSEPIRFLPNGRTEDAFLQLSGPRDFFVDLKIRGLTGAISYTAPFRIRSREDFQTETDMELDTVGEADAGEGLE